MKESFYGETPLTSWQKLVEKGVLSASDKLFELGSGRGKGCFWLSQFVKCEVVGVEWNPSFVFFANVLQKLFRYPKLSFLCADFYEQDFSSATVLYLYGTCLKEEEIRRLIEKMKGLQKGAKIFTISYSLASYEPSFFEEKEEFLLSFPWGEASAYLQLRK